MPEEIESRNGSFAILIHKIYKEDAVNRFWVGLAEFWQHVFHFSTNKSHFSVCRE